MAKKHFVGVILGVFISIGSWAETTSASVIATPPQPSWSELTVAQKLVLAPLCDEWDSFEPFRRKKWLGIAARFASMTPEEQQRIQLQMQEWRRMTPEQRSLARENFKSASQLTAAQRQALKQKWEEYSSLPEEEKEKLKELAADKATSRPLRPFVPAQTASSTARPLPPLNRTPSSPLPVSPGKRKGRAD